MNSINIGKVSIAVLAVASVLVLASGDAYSEGLNTEGANPHVNAPKKRISQAQKNAAAEARKKHKQAVAEKAVAKKQAVSSESVVAPLTDNGTIK